MEHFINYYVSQNLINVAKTFSEIGILKSFVQGLSHLKPIPTLSMFSMKCPFLSMI